jgi:chemotaxis protein MotB
MASDSKKTLQPIIIKKIKKGGHAAHGGAWKIAYADFVTAMMAFFLLMWLLGSTATGDLQGIASYFQTPLKVALQGGSGSGSSTSIVPGGGKDLSRSNGQVRNADNPSKKSQAELEAEATRRDRERISQLQAKIANLISSQPRLQEFQSQIRLEMTPDGLRIQIVDEQNRPMFDMGSALVKPYMREILREIGNALKGVENRVNLEGHTDAAPYGNGDRGYSNWELSADRANASRRELIAGGMPDEKLARVTGLASSSLMEAGDPRAPVNRRISIIVLTRAAEARLSGTLPAAEPAEAAATAPATPAATAAPTKH